jgi:hypothetical protein
MINNLQTKMAHTYIIDIREAEAEMRVDIFHILHDGVNLPADIAGRLLNRKKQLIR